MRRVAAALTPLILALVGVAVGLAVAPDVRAGWVVLGVTATVVGSAVLGSASFLFVDRKRQPPSPVDHEESWTA